MESLYVWHQVAWDISVDKGMKDLQTCDGFVQQIADEMCIDILSGKLRCWTKDGAPIRGEITYEDLRQSPPHLTVDSANKWLNDRRYLYVWTPKATQNQSANNTPDYSILATADELIKAFGKSTGMSKDWFTKNHSSKITEARVVTGKRGRSGAPALYCPFRILTWLTNERRGSKLPINTGWSLLERNFPLVFEANRIADPR
jgi:hypothetical protein